MGPNRLEPNRYLLSDYNFCLGYTQSDNNVIKYVVVVNSLILMTFYLSIILDLQNFFHWYILQSCKLKRPQIQLRPYHFWTCISNLTTVVNSVLIFMIKRDDFNFKIINFPNMCSNIPASPAYGVYISQLIRYVRASSNYSDFLKRYFHLRNRLLD